MKRQTSRKLKVAAVMHDAKPSFVSLVDHGANQQGFTALKRVSAPETEDADMTKGLKGTVTKANKPLEVAKITFPKANFADETAVKVWLGERGFVDATIEADGDTFVAKAADIESFGDLTEIEGENGTVYFVGKEPETAAKSAVEEPAAEAAAVETPAEPAADAAAEPVYFAPGFTSNEEVVQRYAGWITEYSEGTTVSQVLQSGADGLPPGFYELTSAMYIALRNNLVTGDYAGARSVINEYGELTVALTQALEAATVSADIVQKAVRDPSVAVETPATETTTTEAAPAATEEGEQDATKTAGDAAVVETETAPSEEAPVTRADLSALAVDIGAAVAAALAPAFADVQKAVGNLGTKQDEAIETVTKSVTEVTSRVDAVEGRTQTRKGVDDETANQPEPTKPQGTKVSRGVGEDPLRGNTLGFRRRQS